MCTRPRRTLYHFSSFPSNSALPQNTFRLLLPGAHCRFSLCSSFFALLLWPNMLSCCGCAGAFFSPKAAVLRVLFHFFKTFHMFCLDFFAEPFTIEGSKVDENGIISRFSVPSGRWFSGGPACPLSLILCRLFSVLRIAPAGLCRRRHPAIPLACQTVVPSRHLPCRRWRAGARECSQAKPLPFPARATRPHRKPRLIWEIKQQKGGVTHEIGYGHWQHHHKMCGAGR